MLITLDPVAMSIGPLAVRWFGLLALAGLGLATWCGLRALERERLPRELALDALAWGLPGGLVGARVVHVLGWWDYYFAHVSELWLLNLDGLSLWGGLVAGGLIGFARLGSNVDPHQRRRMLDAVAPGMALGLAIGGLGAFVDGHGQGVPSALPWATQYANPLAATPDFGVARHPVQVYEALVALGLGVVVSRVPRRWPAGSRVATLLVLYSTARLLLGGVRLDPSFVFGLQLEQLLALGGLGFGLAYALRPVLSSADAAPRLTATLYMKPDCHLCETAHTEMGRLGARYPHILEAVDIGKDDDLVRQYWERIPVLKIGGREYDAPLEPALLERALQQASAEQAAASVAATRNPHAQVQAGPTLAE